MIAIRKDLESLLPRRGGADSHPGLILQCHLYKWATGDQGDPEEKRDLLRAAIEAARNAEVRALYTLAFDRWTASFPGTTVSQVRTTQGRLVVGLGTENVLETGIRLHHTLGMPILPGSALKGLAAHYCDRVWGASEEKFEKPTKEHDESYRKYLDGKAGKPDASFHRLLFGNTDDGGCIVFHDAWFVPGSDSGPLKLDVMTPHHPGWLDGKVAPTDFDSPIPVPFLSVSGSFLVAVSWCGPPTEKAACWTALAFELLSDALVHEGIGGKTSSGYGRLIEPPPPSPPEPHRDVPAGTVLEAVLLEGRTKSGGWRAQIKGYSQSGPIQNSKLVPESSRAGDTVTLAIASINKREAAFKWPEPKKP